MTWNDVKTRIKDSYEQCKTFAKEHPVETVLSVLGIGVGGFGIYKLCMTPHIELVSVATESTASQQVYSSMVDADCGTATELVARAYTWHEESHAVRGHLRHLSDGRIIPVSPYTKVTGGRV